MRSADRRDAARVALSREILGHKVGDEAVRAPRSRTLLVGAATLIKHFFLSDSTNIIRTMRAQRRQTARAATGDQR